MWPRRTAPVSRCTRDSPRGGRDSPRCGGTGARRDGVQHKRVERRRDALPVIEVDLRRLASTTPPQVVLCPLPSLDPTSPHISPHLPAPPRTSSHLPTSPPTSPPAWLRSAPAVMTFPSGKVYSAAPIVQAPPPPCGLRPRNKPSRGACSPAAAPLLPADSPPVGAFRRRSTEGKTEQPKSKVILHKVLKGL